jgi:predicted HTH domain antitoxin
MPGEVDERMHRTEVRKELALALYARGILGFGKARELCGLTKWQFEELLGRRKVIRPYDEDDLASKKRSD